MKAFWALLDKLVFLIRSQEEVGIVIYEYSISPKCGRDSFIHWFKCSIKMDESTILLEVFKAMQDLYAFLLVAKCHCSGIKWL